MSLLHPLEADYQSGWKAQCSGVTYEGAQLIARTMCEDATAFMDGYCDSRTLHGESNDL